VPASVGCAKSPFRAAQSGSRTSKPIVARELEESAIGSMLRMAPDDPDRLLEEIAEKLLADVSQREAELAELLG